MSINSFMEIHQSKFGLLVVGLNEEGPEILQSCRLPWLDGKNGQDYLLRFALDTVVLSLRDKYKDTVADLPVPDSDKWRALVFSIDMANVGVPDHENFLQLIVLIPLEVHRQLKSSSLWQREIIELIKSMITSNMVFDDEISRNIRDKILYHLLVNVNGR